MTRSNKFKAPKLPTFLDKNVVNSLSKGLEKLKSESCDSEKVMLNVLTTMLADPVERRRIALKSGVCFDETAEKLLREVESDF